MDNNQKTDWEVVAPCLLAAQMAVSGVHKASRNDFGGYMYASAEDMIIESRKVLHDNGLLVMRKSWVIDQNRAIDADGTLADGKPVVSATYILAHTSGATITCETDYPIVVGKGRPEDKALNAALTTALSYFLRDLLLIPRCDEEVDKRPDTISRSGTRDTPTPAGKSGSNRAKFMRSMATWINREHKDDETFKACIAALKLNGYPTDGSCTGKQFGKMVGWVEEQISGGNDANDVLPVEEE